MLLRLFCLYALLFVSIPLASAQSGKRFALLIGNQSYTEAVGPLKNPHNDVRLVGDALRELNFTVTEIRDADYRRMDTAIKRYVMRVRRAGPNAISFVYYSGHGIANPDTKANYLVPIDVKKASNDDLWVNSFEQSQIVGRLRDRAPNATHYVVFDACRNELKVTGSAASQFKSLGSSKGFQPVQNTAGILIAYATAPGQTASDRGVGGGAYAKALAAELVRPGAEAVTMFRRVQLRVKTAIGQDPWLSIPTLPEVFLAGRKTVELDTGDRTSEQLKRLRRQLEADRRRVEQERRALEERERRRLEEETARQRALQERQARERQNRLQICQVYDVRPPDDWLALRTQPSGRRGTQLARLPRGTRLEMLGPRSGAWRKVRAFGQVGWVSWQKKRWIKC